MSYWTSWFFGERAVSYGTGVVSCWMRNLVDDRGYIIGTEYAT